MFLQPVRSHSQLTEHTRCFSMNDLPACTVPDILLVPGVRWFVTCVTRLLAMMSKSKKTRRGETKGERAGSGQVGRERKSHRPLTELAI